MVNFDINEVRRLNLLRFKEERGLKNVDLARILKYKPSFVSALLKKTGEKGSSNIGPKVLRKLQEGLKVDADEFHRTDISETISLIDEVETKVKRPKSATLQAITNTKEIMESGHDVIVSALLANLVAFKSAIQNEGKLRKDVDKLKNEVDHLKTLSHPLRKPDTGRVTGTGT